jgi:hypothetical protein
MEKYMTVYIYKLSIFRMQPIKKIKILYNLKNYLLSQGESGREDIEKLSWLFKPTQSKTRLD